MNSLKIGRGRKKGFTLVEVLVALAIVMFSIATFYRISADIAKTESRLNVRSSYIEIARNVLADVEPSEVLDAQKSGTDGGCGWKAHCDAVRSYSVREYAVCHLLVEIECGDKDTHVHSFVVPELLISKKLPGGKIVWLD